MVFREVDLSYEVDGISKGRVYIHFDSHTKGKLGCVQLDGGLLCMNHFVMAAFATAVLIKGALLFRGPSLVRPHDCYGPVDKSGRLSCRFRVSTGH